MCVFRLFLIYRFICTARIDDDDSLAVELDPRCAPGNANGFTLTVRPRQGVCTLHLSMAEKLAGKIVR